MAVRPIDANELLGIERLLDTDVVRQSKTASWLLNQVLHDIQAMPTLTPPNEPLTSDELLKMDGEPVYVVFRPDNSGDKPQFWALVSADKQHDEVYLLDSMGGAGSYDEIWANLEAIYLPPAGGRGGHLMDIEKLIDRLKKASADGSWNTLADYAHKAATALSTLQAENAKLLAELEKVKAERDAAVSDLETIMAYGGGNLDTCQFCKNSQCYARGGTNLCLPEWRGQKED